MSLEEVEKLVGRPLKRTEKLLFEMYKNNPGYEFSKDRFHNLKITEKDESIIYNTGQEGTANN